MARKKKDFKEKYTVFACDTESSPRTGAVWAVQCAPLDTPDDIVLMYPSFTEFFQPLIETSMMYGNILLYFHNLKWDGQHIIHWLLHNGYTWCAESRLRQNQFNTLITDLGTFYSIRIKVGRNNIEIRDSLKILPFSLKKLGKDFKLKHQKLEMDYNKESLDDCTEEDFKYLKNDVLVLKDALNFMIEQRMTSLTIGGCCMEEYKMLLNPEKHWCDLLKFTEPNTGLDADMYCRASYRGGYCISWQTGHFENGMTFDVNSLYPSMMNSDRLYPVGEPHFWSGKIPLEALERNYVFIIRFKCDFELKPHKLPTLQLKGCDGFSPNEWLKTNLNVYGVVKGKPVDNRPAITMTSVDWELFNQNYEISNLEVLDGCWFDTMTGLDLYGKYIDHWCEIKQTSTGAKRQLAKLMLNNLYGKLGTSRRAVSKEPYLNEDGVVCYRLYEKSKDKKLTYVPQACFITAYARQFTIKTAQANIGRLCYIDTDSIHITGLEPPKALTEHPTRFSCWKCETTWDEAFFLRQKTYAEHVVQEDHKDVEPYWNMKACGLPERSKQLFLAKCDVAERPEHLTEEEAEYLKTKADITDFAVGLNIPLGKLQAKNTPLGTILEERGFTVNNRVR